MKKADKLKRIKAGNYVKFHIATIDSTVYYKIISVDAIGNAKIKELFTIYKSVKMDRDREPVNIRLIDYIGILDFLTLDEMRIEML